MNYKKKKIRGGRRNLDNFLSRLDLYTQSFPGNDDRGYWHLHMPCSNVLLDSPKTPSFVKRETVQKIFMVVDKLIKMKPNDESFIKVVGAIDIPNLWQSQIIVFYDKDYYSGFFSKKTDEQRWDELGENKACDFIERYKIARDNVISIKGFKETIIDDGEIYNGEIWFVGELD